MWLVAPVLRPRHLGYVPREIAATMDSDDLWVITDYRVLINPEVPEQPGLEISIARIEWAPEPEMWIAVGRDPSVGRQHRLALVPSRLRTRALVTTPTVIDVDNSLWAVESSSFPGLWRAVVGDSTEDGICEFMCACPSGYYRPDHLIPCIHAAAVGVWLEQHNFVIWDEEREVWYWA